MRDFRRVRIGTLLALDESQHSSLIKTAVYGARQPTMGARNLLMSGTVILGTAFLLTLPYATKYFISLLNARLGESYRDYVNHERGTRTNCCAVGRHGL